MAKMQVSTVGKDKESKAAEKAERKASRQKRPEFNLASAVDSNGAAIPLDEEGRLTAPPANWNKEFRPLKRGAFASREAFFQFKIGFVDRTIARLQETRQELADRAAGKQADPAKVKAKRRAKLMKELAELEASMRSEGAIE
jgi:hypothetical protein